jgi:sialate O-acetylesterase
MFRSLAVLVTIFATLPCARAEIRLPNILSSHMVLQRDRPIHIWGWAAVGESVSVSLNQITRNAKSDDLGRWSVYLPPQPVGGPQRLIVAGTNTLTLEDILIGDVWFASGQSNMEMPLQGFPPQAFVKDSAEEIKGADQPQLRLLHLRNKSSEFPLSDNDAKWTVCSPETAKNFSAVAYFFGRDLAAKEHVPIGLIDSTWGGTPAEAWVSMDTLSSDASLMPVFAARGHMMEEQELNAVMLEREKREGKTQWHPDPASWRPGGLYNGMVAPAVGYGIKGVIWYQGESNTASDRAYMYEKVFAALIGDWRAHWHEGPFPFLFVQIANFGSKTAETWPIVREAQRRSLSVANTAMAVAIDVGTPDNVHPPDKQTVAARLGLAARALAYGEASIEYSGPAFRQVSSEENGIRVWFDHVSDGLQAKGPALSGFEVAGADHKFSPASARIEGTSVFVSNEQIASPKYVRYGWRNSPDVNLYNSAGLPASPFTSEEDHNWQVY